jgi:hypothetical protein
VDFIFDQQGELNQKDALGFRVPNWFPRFCRLVVQFDLELEAYLPPEPTFRASRYCSPLQAADLYAWNVRRRLFENKVISMPDSYELPALDNMQKIDRVLDILDVSQIMSALQKI